MNKQRFDSKWVHEPNTGCHIWTDSITSHGYGQVKDSGKQRRAHRVAYELTHGDIPAGMHIDHICKVRCCVNPDHLRAVTPRQNVTQNSLSIQAINAAKTHCKRGHPFNAENTLRRADGGRVCRICNEEHNKETRAKRWGRRAAMGQCVKCGQPALPGHRQCVGHASRSAELARAQRARKSAG